MTRNTWRSSTPVAVTYLITLAGWGYLSCPVERIAAVLDIDETEADADGGATSDQ